jgi:hypothetical protein
MCVVEHSSIVSKAQLNFLTFSLILPVIQHAGPESLHFFKMSFFLLFHLYHFLPKTSSLKNSFVVRDGSRQAFEQLSKGDRPAGRVV